MDQTDTDDCDSTVFIPIFREATDVFGRRWPTIFAVSMFMVGSGIAGGATSTVMIIGLSCPYATSKASSLLIFS